MSDDPERPEDAPAATGSTHDILTAPTGPRPFEPAIQYDVRNPPASAPIESGASSAKAGWGSSTKRSSGSRAAPSR